MEAAKTGTNKKEKETLNDKVYFKGKEGKAMQGVAKTIKDMQKDSLKTRPQKKQNVKLTTDKGGRPSKMNDENLLKMMRLAKDGKKLGEVAKTLGIKEKTVEWWFYQNYKGFQEKWLKFKHEGQIARSEEVSDEILDLPTEMVEIDDDGKKVRVVKNPEIIRIKQNESQFIRKTIGREEYKDTEDKQEATVNINIINYSEKTGVFSNEDKGKHKEVIEGQTEQA